MEEQANQNLLEVKDLKVIYKTDEAVVRAVNGISFSIAPGETMGLVGETGAGKSTTALSIMQLLPERTGRIENGEIVFRGENLLKKSPAEIRSIRGKGISMIFQDPMTSLNPIMSVSDQIRESLEIHASESDTPEDLDKRVDELLKLVGIQPSRKNNYPNQFSGGMRQRIVIAMAIACNPALIIADEPTTALDVTIQAQVLALMSELKEKINTSLLLITHDLGVVAQVCDKVSVMYAGEIIESGTVEDIFNSKDRHPYTEGLFNSIPDVSKSTPRLKPIHGLMPDPTDLPKGCKFHPRCEKCMQICKEKQPGIFVEGDHRIACHLFDKSMKGE